MEQWCARRDAACIPTSPLAAMLPTCREARRALPAKGQLPCCVALEASEIRGRLELSTRSRAAAIARDRLPWWIIAPAQRTTSPASAHTRPHKPAPDVMVMFRGSGSNCESSRLWTKTERPARHNWVVQKKPRNCGAKRVGTEVAGLCWGHGTHPRVSIQMPKFGSGVLLDSPVRPYVHALSSARGGHDWSSTTRNCARNRLMSSRRCWQTCCTASICNPS